MSKIIKTLILTIIISLSACGGNVKDVNIKEVESKYYTSNEINSAIETIIKEFDKEWDGCTLNEIYYAGDSMSKDYQDWADRNGVDEVIVLLSSFDVDSSGGDGTLNSNSTYDGWLWILVRKTDGPWKHVDHGY
ncbi:MAG: hypothetical protein HGA35_02595 [Erysipelotrichaceae bacterium]|nr:hypothetical protein [Erysipelotrichaceae bacterium]